MIFAVFITVSGVPQAFTMWITGLPVSRYAVLIIILVIYIPLGMVLDALSMILLTIPTFYPVIAALGFDPIWFGVIIVLLEQIALITPPVGMVCYILQGVTKVPLAEIFRGIIPFVIAMLVGIVILVAFPQISLFLPETMG
jgi:C4-dicarboxylate transporter DctM subunit